MRRLGSVRVAARLAIEYHRIKANFSIPGPREPLGDIMAYCTWGTMVLKGARESLRQVGILAWLVDCASVREALGLDDLQKEYAASRALRGRGVMWANHSIGPSVKAGLVALVPIQSCLRLGLPSEAGRPPDQKDEST